MEAVAGQIPTTGEPNGRGPRIGLRRSALLLLALIAFLGTFSNLDRPAGAAGGGEVSARIIGGAVAPPDSWPSQAALLFASTSNPANAQFCGGTLIGANWVMTAAHCVDFLDSPGEVNVAIGINDLNDVSPGDRKAVESITIHPDWNPGTEEWDFALLELQNASSQPTMDLIAPSELADTAVGKPARIAGWGCTLQVTREECRNLGGSSDLLREATVAYVGDAACSSAYGSDFRPLVMICAGIYPEGGIDTCFGDSGGPLTASVGGRRVLAGLTSWGGEPCGLPGEPGVYSRVSAARSWALGVIAGNPRLEVTRSGTGSGSVSSSPAGISCGTFCSAGFSLGSIVQLTAKADPGSGFVGWSGACSGSGACLVTMDSAKTVGANFRKGPVVTLRSRPPRRASSRRATFRFVASQSGSTLRCRIDGKSWGRCSSPRTYRNLERGRKHTFRVKARRDGITGPIRQYRWFIGRR